MSDVHSKEVRSYNMSKIRAKDTKPELVVRKFLFKNGFRYRLHVKDLPGKPDLVFRKHKIAVFIHGCFWHGHDSCKYFKIPGTRKEWWVEKINRNKMNDLNADFQLKRLGYRVIVIWECELRPRSITATLESLLSNFRALTDEID